MNKITTGKENFALCLAKSWRPQIVSVDQCITVLEVPPSQYGSKSHLPNDCYGTDSAKSISDSAHMC